MTKPGASVDPSEAKGERLRRIFSHQGEIRPVISGSIVLALVALILILVLELGVILLSLAGVGVFKYLQGSTVLTWLAHWIYL